MRHLFARPQLGHGGFDLRGVGPGLFLLVRFVQLRQVVGNALLGLGLLPGQLGGVYQARFGGAGLEVGAVNSNDAVRGAQ